MSDASARGRSSRQKGKRGERLIAQKFKDFFPELAEQIKRGWQSRSGQDDPDVKGVPSLWIEVKFGAKPNPRAALAQAIEANTSLTPVAVIKDNRKEPFVVMTLDDFLVMLKQAFKGGRLDNDGTE